MSIIEFEKRTQIATRFKRALVIFWLPLILLATVPALLTAITALLANFRAARLICAFLVVVAAVRTVNILRRAIARLRPQQFVNVAHTVEGAPILPPIIGLMPPSNHSIAKENLQQRQESVIKRIVPLVRSLSPSTMGLAIFLTAGWLYLSLGMAFLSFSAIEYQIALTSADRPEAHSTYLTVAEIALHHQQYKNELKDLDELGRATSDVTTRRQLQERVSQYEMSSEYSKGVALEGLESLTHLVFPLPPSHFSFLALPRPTLTLMAIIAFGTLGGTLPLVQALLKSHQWKNRNGEFVGPDMRLSSFFFRPFQGMVVAFAMYLVIESSEMTSIIGGDSNIFVGGSLGIVCGAYSDRILDLLNISRDTAFAPIVGSSKKASSET
jgi:hypothetical protein